MTGAKTGSDNLITHVTEKVIFVRVNWSDCFIPSRLLTTYITHLKKTEYIEDRHRNIRIVSYWRSISMKRRRTQGNPYNNGGIVKNHFACVTNKWSFRALRAHSSYIPQKKRCLLQENTKNKKTKKNKKKQKQKKKQKTQQNKKKKKKEKNKKTQQKKKKKQTKQKKNKNLVVS